MRYGLLDEHTRRAAGLGPVRGSRADAALLHASAAGSADPDPLRAASDHRDERLVDLASERLICAPTAVAQRAPDRRIRRGQDILGSHSP